ncbi:MAG: hypothetical protein P8170_20140 [Gemmatimonadota bacterium]
MSASQKQPSQSTFGRNVIATSLLLATGLGAGATGSSAQEAIGVPFIGKNHLSFYTTEVSQDGIGVERTAIFGGAYGRAFGGRTDPVQISMIVRAGARPLDDLTSGVLDAATTLAATRQAPGIERLSLTAAAGVGVMLWGQGSAGDGLPDTGRSSLRVPLSAGAAYRLRAGGATIAPFAMLTTAYSRESDHVGGQRIGLDSGWRVGHTTGVSLSFTEMVLSVADVRRERGMPNHHRVVFSVGMSW